MYSLSTVSRRVITEFPFAAFCSIRFFQPKPEFQFKPVDEFGGTICRITLPANAPISEIVSSLLPSIEAAKKNACLKAVYKLHSLGVLNNFLLPDSNEETEDELSDEELDFDKGEGA